MPQADRLEGRRPTLHDVARRAGVSAQTVSNVINAPHKVRPATRRRIEKAIARLGYQANWAARSLRDRSSRFIGYQVAPATSGADSVSLDRFLFALSDATRDAGYLVVLFAPHEIGEAPDSYRELARQGVVDGFVLTATAERDERAKVLLQHGVAFATFGRTALRSDHSWVDIDHTAGVRMAVEHLISAGHRHVAFVGVPEGSAVGERGLDGYRAAMETAGFAIRRGDVLGERDGVDVGRRLGRRLFARRHPPTAIVAVSDLLAAGCLAAAAERGFVVGSDVAVIGYGNSPLARSLNPSLSSVGLPIESAAREIARILLATLTGGDASPRHVLLAPSLVRRASG